MKVNLKKPVADLAGRPIMDGKDGITKTLESVVCTSLYAAQSKEGDAEAAYQTYKLLRRIMGAAGEVEISVEEASIIKKEVSKNYVIGVAGQVMDAIEQAN